MNSPLELSEVSPAAAPAAANQASAHAHLVDAAYGEYHRRRARGEVVDRSAFCEQFPSVRSSLGRLIDAEEWLDFCPELITDPPASWPQAGTLWEGFDLLEELGRGAFARVYLARELALGGRLVAIKCAPLGAREAATLGRLDHPNVVPIHSIRDLPDHNLTVVCMPYLGQTTLLQLCREIHGQPQPPALAAALLDACRDPRLPAGQPPALLRRGAYLDGVLWVAARVAGALAYLHGQGICHRDLKPSNILIQPDGEPRLLDFNLSADARLPQAQVGGTLHYMAPEQLEALKRGNDDALTPKVDVFALGVILFEWLTGRHPCAPLPADAKAKTLLPFLLQHYRQTEQPLPAPAGVEPALAELIGRCLRPNPEDRPTATDVECALRGRLRAGPRLARAIVRRPLRAAVVTLVVASGIALGGYQATHQVPRSQAAYEQGWKAFRAGDYAQAMDLFNDAAAHGADAVDCLRARARIFQHLGETRNAEFFSQALTEYRHAFDRTGQGKYAAAMGYCAHRMKLFAAADEYYKKAIELGFKHPALGHNRGCLLLDQGKLPDARACFERALNHNDAVSLTHFQLADTLIRMHQQKSGSAPDPDSAMPELLRNALQQLQRGLPKKIEGPAPLALHLARMYAAVLPYDPTYAERTLDWLECAVQGGIDPALLEKDRAFDPVRANARFVALVELPASPRPTLAWVCIIDPLAD